MTAQAKRAELLSRVRQFYMGRAYPAVVCALVLLASLSGLEIYVAIVTTALFVGAFLFSSSIRPVIVSMCTYIFQVSTKNSPSLLNNSDFLYTGWRIYIVIACITAIIAAAFYFFFKQKLYKKINLKTDSLMLPTIALAVALLLGGLFSSSWQPMSLAFSFAQVAVYVVVFALFRYGFTDEEDNGELMSYFAYVASLIAGVIIIQLAHLFITSDNIFVDGAINKVAVSLGWGIWNLVGACLAMLIPVIFFGVMTSKYSWIYFVTATAAWLAAVLTMSRNALIFATLAYGVSLIIACFFGKYKKAYRIVLFAGLGAIAVLAIVLWDKIAAVLADYLERGFDSNGRFELWAIAWKNFLDCPIFGRGFCGFEDVHKLESGAFAHMGPMPTMAHNTPLELLSATGAVGVIAYGFYRVRSLIPVFKKPNLAKTMLALSIVTTLLGSLLDNFVFNIYPMFFSMAALALLHRRASAESGTDNDAQNNTPAA